jgi:hypothetical protein
MLSLSSFNLSSRRAPKTTFDVLLIHIQELLRLNFLLAKVEIQKGKLRLKLPFRFTIYLTYCLMEKIMGEM